MANLNRFTIQQLQQMRESEDRVEFKAGEGGKPMSDAVYLKILQESEPDFSEKICEGLSLEDLDEEAIRVMKKKYADRWEKPEFNNIPTNQVLKDFMLMDNDGHLNYAALILLAKSDVDNILSVNSMPRSRQDPALLLLIHDIQHNRATTEQLNAFDLLALYRVSRGESIRNVDSVTLKKLLSQELLIETSDGIKLTPLYDEMKLRTCVTDKTEDKNVPVNDTIKLSQLTERQRKIYETIKNVPVNVPVNIPNLASMLRVSEKTIKRDIAAMQSAGFIKRIGSDKTGHWEIIDNVK